MAALGRRLRNLARFLAYRGRLAPYLRPHRARFAGAIGLSVLFAGARLLEPWPLQIVLDQVVLGKPSQLPGGLDPLRWVGGRPEMLLAAAAAGLLLLALISGGLYYAQTVLVARIGQLVARDLREDVFHHLLRHSLAFHRRHDPGDLLMRLTGDMVFLREMILATIVTMTGELVVLLSTLALMFVVSPKLTLVTLAVAPALAILFGSFRGRMREAARKQRKREGQIARRITESLLAIPMIQAFTAEGQEDERFRRTCKRSERMGLRAARLEAGMQRTVEVLIALGTCLVLWFGIREVLAERITPGVFLVFLAYLRALFKPVRKLAKVAERAARASAAAERVLEVLEARREIKDSKKAVAAPALAGGLRLDGVGFVYEDGTMALEGVSAEVLPGEQIAIAGRSGAGKSTLFSLILGFHRPTSGRIYFDGEKARRYTLASLRSQIAYLPQEPFVVAGTVRENLLYGRPGASDADLWRALEVAELARDVRALPDGLDARIASRGQSLSGGQKQRLAIARAVLKDAPILLLDEPASGLDPETETALLRGLERLRAGRTTLVIAHRPETLRTVNRIWVLDRGRLVRDVAAEAAGEVPLEFPESSSHEPRAVGGVPGLVLDPEVRGVARLAEPGERRRFLREVATLLQAARADDGPRIMDPASIPAAEATPEPSQMALGREAEIIAVKQRLGQRAILRVRTAGSRCYVKLFRSRDAKRVDSGRTVEMLAAAAGITAPRTLGWIDRYRALVIEEAGGTPWLELPAERRLELASALGTGLSRLHLQPPPEGWMSVEDERPRLERAAERAARSGGANWTVLAPHWNRAVGGLFEERNTERGSADGAVGSEARDEWWRRVPIHGDVHPDQVRSGPGGSVVLLDWDGAGIGEATRDLGNVVAHLELDTARGVLAESEAQALTRAVVEAASRARVASDGGRERGRAVELGERDSRGPSDRDSWARSVDWHRRATLLRLAALYSDPSFGTRAPNAPTLAPELLRRAQSGGPMSARIQTAIPATLVERVR